MVGEDLKFQSLSRDGGGSSLEALGCLEPRVARFNPSVGMAGVQA